MSSSLQDARPRRSRPSGSRPSRPLSSQSGSILVLTLIISMVLLGLGLAAMWMSSSGTKISGHYTRRQEALAAAEAGVAVARSVLLATTLAKQSWSTVLDGCGGAKDAKKGHFVCDAGKPLQNMPLIDATSKTAAKATGLANQRYTVYVRNDPEEGGVTNETDGNGRVIVRSEGIGRDGTSYVAVEVIVAEGGGSTTPNLPYSQAGLNARGSNSMKGKIN